jgi:hypothetical protein
MKTISHTHTQLEMSFLYGNKICDLLSIYIMHFLSNQTGGTIKDPHNHKIFKTEKNPENKLTLKRFRNYRMPCE